MPLSGFGEESKTFLDVPQLYALQLCIMEALDGSQRDHLDTNAAW